MSSGVPVPARICVCSQGLMRCFLGLCAAGILPSATRKAPHTSLEGRMFRSEGDRGRGGPRKNRFMNARGPHKFIAGKMHYDARTHACTQDRYVTETGGEEGEKKNDGEKKRG